MIDVLLGSGITRRPRGEDSLHRLEECHLVPDANVGVVRHRKCKRCDSSRAAR